MSDVKAEILNVVNIEDYAVFRFLNSVEYIAESNLYLEAWKNTVSDYQDGDDFEADFLDNIETALDAKDYLTSYEDEAAKIVLKYHDELFDPSKAENYVILPEVRHEIAEMSEGEIIDIIAEELADKDNYTLKECIVQANAKVRVGYSPNYTDYDASRVYNSGLERTDVSDGNFLNGLKFFGLQPSKLRELGKDYNFSEEMEALPDFDEKLTPDIATNERAFLIIENAFASWVPVLMFHIEFPDLVKLKPGTTFKVKNGGDLGALDLLNGGGHSEMVEAGCYKEITVSSADEFLNFCDGSYYGKMIVDGFGVVKQTYNVDLTIL